MPAFALSLTSIPQGHDSQADLTSRYSRDTLGGLPEVSGHHSPVEGWLGLLPSGVGPSETPTSQQYKGPGDLQ